MALGEIEFISLQKNFNKKERKKIKHLDTY